MADIKEGSRLGTAGKYTIASHLGTGGFGVVWKARDTVLQRDVAIKRLCGPKASESVDEARKTAQMQHSNIVQVFDAFEEGGDGFIVMELVTGPSLVKKLQDLIGKNWLSQEEALSIFEDCLEALSHAHRKNVLHRDIKPENILLSDLGEAKLVDFGIAKVKGDGGFGATNQATVDGARTGTMHYMSPEQAAGKPLDFSSDIFSLGIVGYLLLTGHHPFVDKAGLFSAFELIKSPTFSPPSVYELNENIQKAVGAVVDRMLNKDPESRFKNIDDALSNFRDASNPTRPCIKCGSENSELSKFCSECGASLLNLAVAGFATHTSLTTTTPAPGPGPDEAARLTTEGYYLANNNEWVAAIDKYRQAVAVDETFAKAYANWGYALNHLGLHDDAIEVLNRAIRLEGHAACFDYRGFAFSKLRKYPEALNDFDRSLELQPGTVKVMLHRAHVLSEIGRHRDALTQVLQALKRDPRNERALRFKARLDDTLGPLGL